MKPIFTFCLVFFNLFISFSQTRYKDELFSEQKHSDIIYGGNFDSKNQFTNLLMDVYTPMGDTSTALRPIVIFVHGGSFVGGDRNDQALNKNAAFFAKKGYVTANIEYRLEQTTFIDPIVNFADTYNWHRAIARATQDLKAAIRYFKKDVATNANSFQVDTNMIFIYGSSAGAITALHAIYLDDTLEMNSVFKAAYNDVGGLDGNSGSAGYNTKGVKAIVSCSGAIADLNMVNNNKDIEYLGFHHTLDFTVPYDIGCFVTVACWLGNYYGDNKIFPKIKNNGTYAEFYPIDKIGHPADQVSDSVTRIMVLQKTTNFLYRIMQQEIVTTIKNNRALSFEIFPNPSSGNVTIQIPKEVQFMPVNVSVCDVSGKIIFTENIENKEQLELNMDVESGMYIITITTQNQQYLAKLNIIK
ncbi:MAG: carboxylesterase family protein [Chitinophagales bacterium]|nr:carboxylesterase family protein [Chitinophagales bacterium]